MQSTWQEVLDAFKAGGCIIRELVTSPFGTNEYFRYVDYIDSDHTPSGVVYSIAANDQYYTCTSPNGYPSNCEGGGGDDPIG